MFACRPIVVLRAYSVAFFQILDVACLTLFLITLDCQARGFAGCSQRIQPEAGMWQCVVRLWSITLHAASTQGWPDI
jgi:hypothetical protein